ncbi:MAG: hypothetical protein ACLGXA_10170 [Acidobacteriota bacterium]
MNTARLITQLLEIERALGHVETSRIRGMLFEAEESVLELEKQMLQIMTDCEGLQMLMEFSRNSAESMLQETDTPAKLLVN